MTVDRRALAAALAMLLVVAACGGSASTAPTSAPEATPTPAATQAPTEPAAPTDTAEPVETEGPTLVPGGAADLEAMLPSSAGGVAFQKASFDGSTVPGGIPLGEGDGDFEKFLSDNGKTLRDVKVAIASPTDSTSGGTIVMAIQVDGVAPDKLLEFAGQSTEGMEKSTKGGKEVWGAGASGFGAYIYIKDDIIFYVLSMGGEDLTDEIFAALP